MQMAQRRLLMLSKRRYEGIYEEHVLQLLSINESGILGFSSIGWGREHLREVFSIMDIPSILKMIFFASLRQNREHTLYEEMLKAGKLEKELTHLNNQFFIMNSLQCCETSAIFTPASFTFKFLSTCLFSVKPIVDIFTFWCYSVTDIFILMSTFLNHFLK